MRTIFPIGALLVAMFFNGQALAEPALPQLLILVRGDVDAEFVNEVKARVESETAELSLKTVVTVVETPSSSKHEEDWPTLVKTVEKPFGTVAIVGLTCHRRRCSLTVMPPKGSYYARIVVKKSEDDRDARVTAVASTIRETLLGPLLPEMKRLDSEGRNPSPAPNRPDGMLLKSPFESTRKAVLTEERPWLWLSGGYHGDHPHPGGHPIHGLFIGVDVIPTTFLGLGIQMGWLGIRRSELDTASASIHRLDTTFALRLLFPIGPAKISISALGRLDAAFVKMTHGGDHPSEKDTRLEVEIGGITMWHLPLPKKLNAWVGAGVLVALYSQEVEVYVDADSKETAIDAATVRMIWCAGVAFSPTK